MCYTHCDGDGDGDGGMDDEQGQGLMHPGPRLLLPVVRYTHSIKPRLRAFLCDEIWLKVFAP